MFTLSFLAFGTIWFWALILSEVIFLSVVTELEHEGKAIASTLVVFGVLFWANTDWFNWIIKHPLWVLSGITAYFVCGTIWSFIKFLFFTRRIKNEYEEAKSDFQKGKYDWMRKGVEGKETDEKTAWLKFLNDRRNKCGYAKYKLESIEEIKYKKRIIVWISYWPFSLSSSIFTDLLKEIAEVIYSMYKNLYSKIYTAVLKDLLDDLKDLEDLKDLKKTNNDIY